jgi:alkanesulfonate monooxygenase SsuD/methylene tetrahydromethanopterin reductase-like flavin-dependent oxidoreductase (luciferase family)
MPNRVHLAVALDGAGWHPAAWRLPDARPDALFTAGYWADLVGVAEAGLLDLVTIDDALPIQSERRRATDERTDRVRGRLDALLVAARVAPTTRHVGLVPTVTTTHTEPFHVSRAVATLDWVSHGRAGVQVRVGGGSTEARLFGRRDQADVDRRRLDDPAQATLMADRFDEAADHVEVQRRLWDSWEDDAEIRDVATGRFVDREKLHYIDFSGRWFDVRGPSITPRPPQGQPVVAALAHVTAAYRLAARAADVVFTTPGVQAQAPEILAEIAAESAAAGRPAPIAFADLVVFLDDAPGAAAGRLARLDDLAGRALRTDARVFAGTAAALADEIEALVAAGYAGVRLRPGALPGDLVAITESLVPRLQRRGLFRTSYEDGDLRARLGLDRPANRYAATVGSGQS